MNHCDVEGGPRAKTQCHSFYSLLSVHSVILGKLLSLSGPVSHWLQASTDKLFYKGPVANMVSFAVYILSKLLNFVLRVQNSHKE